VKVTKNISNLASKMLINIDLVVISFALHFTQTILLNNTSHL